MPREYFYKDSKGQVVPYHYCSECGKQYTNEDFVNGLIVNVGTQVTPIKYCVRPCLDLKFPDKKPQSFILPKRLHAVNIEKEEEIPKDIEVEIPEELPEEFIEEIMEPEKKAKEIKPVKSPEPPAKPDPLEKELKKLSAKQIIEKVKTDKGIEITGDLKSKKVIIRRALKAYNNIPILKKTEPSNGIEGELNKLSAKQIVEKVKAEKGIEITCNIKSKKVIVKRAMKIYQEAQ